MAEKHTPHGNARPDLQAGFEVAGWNVRPRLNRIRRGAETVTVEPKIMQVLVCLAAHAGEPVTREEILDAVWAETVVTDDVLTRSVSELRKLFGDDPRAGRVIETLPKVGYRLVAPVHLDLAGDSLPQAIPLADVAPAVPTSVKAAPRRRRRLALAAVLGTIVLGTLGAGLGGWLLRRPAPVQPLHARPLTSLPGREYSAALSPDGRHVAFAWSRDEPAGTDLYVADVEAMTPLRLTDHPDVEARPAWSPDGRRIAFVRRTADGCAFYAVPALGGPETKLLDCPFEGAADFTWAPDGQSLAVTYRASGAHGLGLGLVSLATGVLRPLTHGAEGNDYAPRFAPDGRTLAFVRSRGERAEDLFRIPVSGGLPQRLTPDSQGIAGFGWTPDGRALVYSTSRSGDFSLWRLPADGGSPRWLGVGVEGYLPSVAPGGRIVYEHWDHDSNLYALDRRTPEAAPRPVVTSTRLDLFPDVSPDGKQLAFVSDRSGRYEVWTSDIDGANARQRTFQESVYASLPRWSPDALRLAYAAYVDGQRDVFVLDAPGAAPRRLSPHDADDTAPAWSPDGRWIYFGSDRNGAWQVWKAPAGGGDAVPVTSGGGYVARPSADGAWLYYTRRGEDGLWKVPAAGGAETRVAAVPARTDPYNWALHAGGFFFVERTETGRALSFFDLAAGDVTERHPPGAIHTEGGLAVSPGGETLFFTRLDRSDADLMLVEGFE